MVIDWGTDFYFQAPKMGSENFILGSKYSWFHFQILLYNIQDGPSIIRVP